METLKTLHFALLHLIIPFVQPFFVMPLIRRRRRVRRTRRKPTALRAVRRLARFVDTELHTNVSTSAVESITSLGTFFNIVEVGQGDDDINRNGIQISMRSLKMKLHFARGSTDTVIRVILFIDRQTNGLFPTVDDLLANTGTGPLMVTSPFNNDNRLRFTILSNFTFGLSEGMGEQKLVSISKKLTHKVRYDGASAGIADVVSGSVLLFVAQASSNGGAVNSVLNAQTRYWFAP